MQTDRELRRKINRLRLLSQAKPPCRHVRIGQSDSKNPSARKSPETILSRLHQSEKITILLSVASTRNFFRDVRPGPETGLPV